MWVLIRDPNQLIIWPQEVAAHPRQDFLWEETCFEIFIGVDDEDFYREINLSLLKHGRLTSLKNIAIRKACLPRCLRYRIESSQTYPLWVKCKS